ncbi:unnamed protein product [Symbiodinium sp. CCMP2592]|nr:unnamed protein product [Symbiodinium sp. CCMP2592]
MLRQDAVACAAFGIRGIPSVVLLNSSGQLLDDSARGKVMEPGFLLSLPRRIDLVSAALPEPTGSVHLRLRYKGREHDMECEPSEGWEMLRKQISSMIDVPPEQLKLFGLGLDKGQVDESISLTRALARSIATQKNSGLRVAKVPLEARRASSSHEDDKPGQRRGDCSPWYQLDLGEVEHVAGVLVAARRVECGQWATRFRVELAGSEHGPWTSADNGREFAGPSYADPVRAVFQNGSQLARFVRILPVSHRNHGSLRADVLLATGEPDKPPVIVALGNFSAGDPFESATPEVPVDEQDLTVSGAEEEGHSCHDVSNETVAIKKAVSRLREEHAGGLAQQHQQELEAINNEMARRTDELPTEQQEKLREREGKLWQQQKDLSAKYAQLQAEYEQAQQEASSSLQARDALERAVQTAWDQQVELERKLEGSRADCEAREVQLMKLQQEHGSLQQQHTELQQAHKSLQREHKRLQTDFERERQSLQADISDAKAAAFDTIMQMRASRTSPAAIRRDDEETIHQSDFDFGSLHQAAAQLFEQPKPVPESVQHKVIEVFRRSGSREMDAKTFRDLWNRAFPHEKLEFKDYGDVKGLLGNIPIVEKVTTYMLKSEVDFVPNDEATSSDADARQQHRSGSPRSSDSGFVAAQEIIRLQQEVSRLRFLLHKESKAEDAAPVLEEKQWRVPPRFGGMVWSGGAVPFSLEQ